MTNVQLTVGVLLILLIVLSGALLIIVVSQQKAVNEAQALGQAAMEYMKKADKKCPARAKDFDGMVVCLQDMKQELGMIGELKEQSFSVPKKNETGFLVLENKGRMKLNSSAFALYKNHELKDEGCVIEGAIDPGYLCRMEFDSPCEKGDVLEVMYSEKRAYLKTC